MKKSWIEYDGNTPIYNCHVESVNIKGQPCIIKKPYTGPLVTQEIMEKIKLELKIKSDLEMESIWDI